MLGSNENVDRRYAETLFLRTLEELEQRAKSNDPHNILKIAKYLRELLLDESRLTDKINQYYRLPIVYTVMVNRKHKGRAISKIPMWTTQDGIDPDTHVGSGKISSFKRDAFIKLVVIIWKGKGYTIRDIIDFEANSRGGVHFGPPKKEHEELNRIFINQYRASLRQLRPIARVVIKGLNPLREEVRMYQSQI